MALQMKRLEVHMVLDEVTGAVEQIFTQPVLTISEDPNQALHRPGVQHVPGEEQQIVLDAFGAAILASEKARLGV